jgi:hypothetical protein
MHLAALPRAGGWADENGNDRQLHADGPPQVIRGRLPGKMDLSFLSRVSPWAAHRGVLPDVVDDGDRPFRPKRVRSQSFCKHDQAALNVDHSAGIKTPVKPASSCLLS